MSESSPASSTEAARETDPSDDTTAEDTVEGIAEPAAGATPDEQVRRRYLEALDRKHGRTPGQGGSGAGAAGPHTSAGSGPAKAQRTFRRKSGG